MIVSIVRLFLQFGERFQNLGAYDLTLLIHDDKACCPRPTYGPAGLYASLFQSDSQEMIRLKSPAGTDQRASTHAVVRRSSRAVHVPGSSH